MARNAPKEGEKVFVQFDDRDPTLEKVKVVEVIGDVIMVEFNDGRLRYIARPVADIYNEQGGEL